MASSSHSVVRKLGSALLIGAALFSGGSALAQESKAKGLQKVAMEDDYVSAEFDGAKNKLNEAVKACGSCSAKMKASLQRDLGVVFFGMNNKAKATAAFTEALKLDPTVTVGKDFRTKEIDAAFADAKKAAGAEASPDAGGGEEPADPKPAGTKPAPGAGTSKPGTPNVNDFAHTAVSEQVVKTPVPVFVEYTGSNTLKRVVLRYKGYGMTDFASVDMAKMKEAGFGAVAKCTDVQQGDFKYFVQGFDDQGDIIASAGSRKSPFVVKIAPSADDLAAEPPHLPGKKPETQCKDACPEGPAGAECRGEDTSSAGGGGEKAEGDECSDNNECKSSSCKDSKCVAALKDEGQSCESAKECTTGTCTAGACAPPAARVPRIWVGVGGAADFTFINGGTDVCLLGAGGVPATDQGYWCTTTEGNDYPTVAGDFSAGKGGAVNGGGALGNIRALVSVDYAVSTNILLGGRFGVVFNRYSGTFGSVFPLVHAEVRGHYVIGNDAIFGVRPFAPYVMFGLGVSQYDASVQVPVTALKDSQPSSDPQMKAGQQLVNASAVGGPGFVSVGGGVRLQLGSPKQAMMLTPLKLVVAIPGGGTAVSLEPEVAFQLGF